MKELIYDILCHANVPRTEAELASNANAALPEVKEALEALKAEGRAAVTKKGKFAKGFKKKEK